MHKAIQKIIFSILCMVAILNPYSFQKNMGDIETSPTNKTSVNLSGVSVQPVKYLPTTTPVLTPILTLAVEIFEEESPLYSDEEIELLALITMAEAEGECEEGKRLVIDTVLNRVDSPYFPDTIYDVIYQPYHFSPILNGRMDRCEVREDIKQLVLEELESRTNYEVIYFRTGGYSRYGTPLFCVGNHYFSSY